MGRRGRQVPADSQVAALGGYGSASSTQHRPLLKMEDIALIGVRGVGGAG